jgi:hypothetical protein
MAAITEGARAGNFLTSEANGTLSRASITILSGEGVLLPGTVLAKITASGKYVKYDNAGSDGSETAAAVLYAGVDATSADTAAVGIVRLAEVEAASLVWFSGAITGDKTAAYADLAVAHVIAR